MAANQNVAVEGNKTASVSWLVYVKWMITLGVPILTALYPLAVKPQVQMFLAITLWAVFMWMFELSSEAIVGIMLPVLYILFQVGPPDKVFAGWSSSIPWVTLGGLVVGMVMVKTGLAKRIAYRLLVLTGTNVVGIVIGLSIASLIITPLVPSVMGKVALIVPLVIGILQALEIKPGSKAAAVILLGVFYALFDSSLLFLTGGADSLMVAALMSKSAGVHISWGQWVYDMMIPFFIWLVLSLGLLFLIGPEKVQVNKSILQDKYNEMGIMSTDEKKTALVVSILLIIFATDKIHKINPEWVILMVASLMFMPPLNLLKKEDLGKINFPIVFYMVGALAIGSLSSVTGTTKVLTDYVQPLLEGKSGLYITIGTYVFGLLAHVLLTTLAAISAFTVPVAEIFKGVGMDPKIGAYTLMFGTKQFLFPYEVAPALFLYSYGYIKLNLMVKVLGIKILFGFVFLALVAYPYWKLIGM